MSSAVAGFRITAGRRGDLLTVTAAPGVACINGHAEELLQPLAKSVLRLQPGSAPAVVPWSPGDGAGAVLRGDGLACRVVLLMSAAGFYDMAALSRVKGIFIPAGYRVVADLGGVAWEPLRECLTVNSKVY
jgi:hypothetical protein